MKIKFSHYAFCSTPPQIWNQIPLAVRTSPLFDCFKHHLKTHYFTIPWDSNPPSNCLHRRFKFSLNAGALTNLITLHSTVVSVDVKLTLSVREDRLWMLLHLHKMVVKIHVWWCLLTVVREFPVFYACHWLHRNGKNSHQLCINVLSVCCNPFLLDPEIDRVDRSSPSFKGGVESSWEKGLKSSRSFDSWVELW